jgi:hypothetical protein
MGPRDSVNRRAIQHRIRDAVGEPVHRPGIHADVDRTAHQNRAARLRRESILGHDRRSGQNRDAPDRFLVEIGPGTHVMAVSSSSKRPSLGGMSRELCQTREVHVMVGQARPHGAPDERAEVVGEAGHDPHARLWRPSALDEALLQTGSS